MCTSIRLQANDGSVLVGRTMEFAAEMGWQLMVAGPGVDHVGSGPDGPGHTWQSTRSVVGVSGLGRASVVDGLNDAGLGAALLYLPGITRYQDHQGVDPSDLVSPDEVATLVLSTCATVAEALEAIGAVVVWERVEAMLGTAIPVHLVLHDRQGASAVVEWIDGTARVHDNPIGVCTNSPSLDWHLTNLDNYVNLTAVNAPPVEIRGMSLAPVGQGSGLHGLPGDLTPPSRFVRAVVMAAATTPPVDGAEGLRTALHLANAFDIPLGVVRDPGGLDYTQWVSVADLSDGVYVLRTYVDPTPRRVRLGDLGLTAGEVRFVALPADPEVLAFAF